MKTADSNDVRPRLGVCSWSLRPSGPADLADKVDQCGVLAVQLALDPLRTGAWDVQETDAALGERGIRIISGMMQMAGEDYSTLGSIRVTGGLRSDHHWQDNLRAAHANAELAARLGIPLITYHSGILPHDANDPDYSKMIERIGVVAEAFHQQGVPFVALETGQESAETLSKVMMDLRHSRLGVNFDPANMILYGMSDPAAALRGLVPWIAQVHIKDAVPTKEPGTWGTEVPVGEGTVRWNEFFACLNGSHLDADLIIEREAGDARIDDVRTAASLVRQFCPRLAGAGHG